MPGAVSTPIRVPVTSLPWLLWQFHQALSIGRHRRQLTHGKGEEIQKPTLGLVCDPAGDLVTSQITV